MPVPSEVSTFRGCVDKVICLLPTLQGALCTSASWRPSLFVSPPATTSDVHHWYLVFNDFETKIQQRRFSFAKPSIV